MLKNAQRLNFSINNLILEKEVNNKTFNEEYQLLQDCAKEIVDENGQSKTNLELLEIAKKSIKSTHILNNNKAFYAGTKVKKLFLITNIIFCNENDFIDVILNHFLVNVDKLYELKDTLNLYIDNEEYLANNINKLIIKYIPNYYLIAEHFKMEDNPDLILVKLLEILYLKPEKFEIKKKNIK